MAAVLPWGDNNKTLVCIAFSRGPQRVVPVSADETRKSEPVHGWLRCAGGRLSFLDRGIPQRCRGPQHREPGAADSQKLSSTIAVVNEMHVRQARPVSKFRQ